jgi:peptidoglycan/LPS O-acetylase OafA/YrhL
MQRSTIGRLDAGDGLRAVAMLSIFVLHAVLDGDRGGLPDPRNFAEVGSVGEVVARMDLGLSIFFVLSGYLIARPFARAFVDGRPRPSVRRFAANRALRILPVWIAVITLALIVFGTQGAGLVDLLAIYAFVDHLYIGHPAGFPVAQGWTLSAEVAFYVSVPGLGIAAGLLGGRLRRPGARALLGLAGIALLTAASLRWRHYAPSEMSGLNNPLTVFFAFAPGIAIALAEPVVAPWLRERPAGAAWAGRVLLAVSAAAVGVYVLAAPDHYAGLHHTRDTQAAASALFGGALVGGMLVLQVAGRRSRLLASRAMSWMGERSYPFYLLHFGVILLGLRALPEDWSQSARSLVLITGGFAVTMVLSHLAHETLERPFLERRRSVSEPAAEPGPPVLAPEPVPALQPSA